MKTVAARSTRSNHFLPLLVLVMSVAPLHAATQIVLARDAHPAGEFRGVVDVAVTPGIDNASVTITVDGQKLVDGLHAPYHVAIDLGPNVVEHKIGVTVLAPDKKRIQWHDTINRGRLPLSIKLKPIDIAARMFEVAVTAPDEDPVMAVEFWDAGQRIGSLQSPPYRFTVPPEHFQQHFVQVTAKTKSGDEAADFWSGTGDVHVESMDVRTVPIFVSVVDRNGVTRDDVDRSLFRILDNGQEAKIIDFGKAFDQPISIALVMDASSSMTYSMDDATRAALTFVKNTLKQGDHCTVFSVRDVPRRELPLTTDHAAVEKAIANIRAGGKTSLYDALTSAIRELRDEKNRRAIVVLTDGGDTSSMASFDEIDRVAQEAGIPMYFIAYDSGQPTEQQDLDRLNYLSGETGGFVATASAHNLQAKYTDIEKDLRAQYAIRYQIAGFGKPNEWRKVHVMLNSPKLTARTIKGYFAP